MGPIDYAAVGHFKPVVDFLGQLTERVTMGHIHPILHRCLWPQSWYTKQISKPLNAEGNLRERPDGYLT